MRSLVRETAPSLSVMCPMETHSKVTRKLLHEHSLIHAVDSLNRKVASKRNTLKTIIAQTQQKQLDLTLFFGPLILKSVFAVGLLGQMAIYTMLVPKIIFPPTLNRHHVWHRFSFPGQSCCAENPLWLQSDPLGHVQSATL